MLKVQYILREHPTTAILRLSRPELKNGSRNTAFAENLTIRIWDGLDVMDVNNGFMKIASLGTSKKVKIIIV